MKFLSKNIDISCNNMLFGTCFAERERATRAKFKKNFRKNNTNFNIASCDVVFFYYL